MHTERRLATSPFPGDDGSADAATRSALAAYEAHPDSASYLRVIAALCLTRLLVPVVATAIRIGPSPARPGPGLVSDKEADMAVVLLESDGARAVLAFTGMDALHAWQPAVRPVPVTLDLAARTAVAERATALLIDPAGPHPLSVESPVLDSLAASHRLVELAPGEFGWAMPADADGPVG